MTAKKYTKKGDARAKLLFCLVKLLIFKLPIIYNTLWSVRNRIFSVQIKLLLLLNEPGNCGEKIAVGHNNTQHFLCPIKNQHSLDRLEMVRWESVPRGFSACAWKLLLRLFSRPDWPPLGLRGCVPSETWVWSKVPGHGVVVLPFWVEDSTVRYVLSLYEISSQ